MIAINVVRDNKEIKKIEVSGHSGYEEAGKDIVCSAVSTSMILTINLLEKLNVNFKCDSDEKIPLISLNIVSTNSIDDMKIINTILENLIDTFKEIQNQYKKYLKIYEIRR